MSETDLMKRLKILASQLGARLFRQNAGQAWIGKVQRGPAVGVKLGPNDVVIRNARVFNAGHKGISDLGGWRPVVITQEMVGQTIAQYLQAEVKLPSGRVTEDQALWIDFVNEAGGRAGVVRCDKDMTNLIGG